MMMSSPCWTTVVITFEPPRTSISALPTVPEKRSWLDSDTAGTCATPRLEVRVPA
jgi:hypothetical protein